MPRAAASLSIAALALVSASLLSPRARAQDDHGSCERPLSELSTWISLGGGGALAHGEASRAFFDMRLGADWTLPMHREGDRRLGPWIELGTSTFATFAATGGLELFVGAVPKPFHLFQYDGEGVLSVRVGTGWVLRRASFPGGTDSPVVAATLAWGYRAPWDLWDSWACECTAPSPSEAGGRHPCRRPARYMVVVRLYVSAQRDLSDTGAWQVSGGLEFEPIGSFRYLLGLY